MAQSNASDDPFAAFQKSLVSIHGGAKVAKDDDPFSAFQKPLAVSAPDLDTHTGEGIYWMLDKSGKQKGIPYSNVRRAVQQGLTFRPDSEKKFTRDIAADPDAVTKFFPELRMVAGKIKNGASAHADEGVRIVRINPAGQPIFGPVPHSGPKGSATRRFGAGFVEPIAGAAMGMYDALSKSPQDETELGIQAGAGPLVGSLAIRAKRLLYDPSMTELQKAAELDKLMAENPQERNWLNTYLATEYKLAGVVPLVGPAVAGIIDKYAHQEVEGNIAGMFGGAAGNVVMEEAPKAVSKGLRSKLITERMPRHAITRIIRPMGKDVQFSKDPVGAILDEGIVGTSLESMGRKVVAKLDTVGKQIDNVVKDPKYAKTQVDLNWVYKPLNDSIDAAEKAGDKKLHRRLWEVRGELRSEWQAVPGSMKPILKRTGRRSMVMSPTDALKFKRMLGKRIRWSQDALDEPVNEALGAVYGNVRDRLDAAVPELKPLNKSYANLVSADKAIERRLPVEQRQALVNLYDLVLGAGSIPLLGVKSVPLILARKATELPIVKTTAAQGAYRLGSRIIGTDAAGNPIYSRGYVPKVPLKASVPAVATMRSQQTLRQLQEEAKKLQPAGSTAPVQASAPQ